MGEKDDIQAKDSPQLTRDNCADCLKNISEFAKSEITYVQSAYKWLISLVSVVAIVGISVGMYFTHKSFSDFKKELHEEVDRLKNEVSRRIDDEFKKENIHNLVEQKAQSRIDNIADALIEKQIKDKISPQIKSAEDRLGTIKADLTVVDNNIKELNAISEFMITVISAQNDDRMAFDKLKSWADNPKFPRHSEALQAYQKIIDEHDPPISLSGFSSNITWKEGIDPAKLSLSEIERAFQSAPRFVKQGLLEYIWNRKDIPKKDKILYLVKVLKNDSSLKVVELAGRYFEEESKQKLKPLVIEKHLEWWEKNKDNFEGK
jgi:hypothetical protein